MQIYTKTTFTCRHHDSPCTIHHSACAVSPVIYVNRVYLYFLEMLRTVLGGYEGMPASSIRVKKFICTTVHMRSCSSQPEARFTFRSQMHAHVIFQRPSPKQPFVPGKFSF